MPTRPLGDQEIRKLTKVGGHSLGVTIPIEIIRELGWRERQKVTVTLQGARIVIEDWQPGSQD